MLHMLNVPQGMKFLAFGTHTTGTFKQGDSQTVTHYGLNDDILLEIPVVGFPRLGSEDVDYGWLRQGVDHGGQKDVEHLDLDGYLIPDSAFLSVASKAPTDRYPSLTAKRFGKIAYFAGSATSRWISSIVPWLGSHSVTSDAVGRWASQSVIRPWRTLIGARWLSMNLLAMVHTGWNLDEQLAFTVSYQCYKFTDDFSKYVKFTVGVQHPVYDKSMTCDTLMTADSDTIRGNAIIRVPTSVTLSAVGELTGSSLYYKLPPLRALERHEVFEGELNPVWGDLAVDCYSQIQLWNGNGLAYSKDLLMITGALKELVASAKSLLLKKDMPGFAKNMADLFLSFRYGWSLTMSDTLSLIDADYERAYPQGRCKRSSAYTYFRNGNTITARMSVYCRPYSNCISDLAGFLQMMDLDITAGNLWDLVPMSFVVDWFVNVGGVLERFDLLAQMDRFSIFLTGKTLKVTNTVSSDKIPGLQSTVGTVQARYYKRAFSTDVTLPSLISSRDSTQKFNHWIEGSALAIQRLR